MIVSELMVEGVKRFRQAKRLTLGKGFNFIYGPSESGKSTSFDCIMNLMFPASSPDKSFAPWGTVTNSRAGLFLKRGNTGVRILKDFQNGMVKLAKQGEDGKFQDIANEPEKTEQMMAKGFGLVSYEQFSRFFTLRQEDMPSSAAKQVIVAQAMPQPSAPAGDPAQFNSPLEQGSYGMAPPPVSGNSDFGFDPMAGPPAGQIGMQGMMPSRFSHMSKEDKLKKLQELNEKFEKAKEADDIQFALDDMERKVFELTNKTKAIQDMESNLERLEKQLETGKVLDELKPDMLERIKSFEDLEAKNRQEITQLENAVYEAEAEYLAISSRIPFFKEPLMLGGFGGVVAGIISQVVLASKFGFIRYLNVLVILGGLGVVAWRILNELTMQGKEKTAKEAFDIKEAEKKDTISRHEIEGAVVTRLMKGIGVHKPKELVEKLEQYLVMKKRRDQTKEDIITAKVDAKYDSIQLEKEKIIKEKEELEEKLRTLGERGVMPDPNELKMEISELEKSLEAPEQPQPPPPPPPGMQPAPIPPQPNGLQAPCQQAAPNPDGTFIMPPKPAEEKANPIEELMLLAEQVLNIDRRTLVSQVKPRFDAFLKAFTSNNYVEGDFTDEQGLSLRTGEMSHYSDFDEISPSGKDSAYLALKLALMEMAARKNPFPIILDDPFHYLDDTRSYTVSKALKMIGETTQVILLSSQRFHSKTASISLNLAENS